MKNYFVIECFESGKTVALDFDQASGGYPYWSTMGLGHKYDTYEKAENEVKSILKNFQTKSGEYYRSNIDVNALKIVEVGVVNTTSVKVVMDNEAIKQNMLKSIKSKLTPEELALIQNEGI